MSMFQSIKSAWSGSRSPTTDDLCETCKVKPKFVENGFKHPYCGRTCARNSQSQNSRPPTCALEDCRRLGRAEFGGFCSDLHARDAASARHAKPCAICRAQPRAVGQLCVSCEQRTHAESSLKELDARDVKWKSVVTEFVRQWQGSTRPNVVKIFEVLPPYDIRKRHEQYRKKLSSAVERNTYYSSECICDLGVKDASLCGWQSCGICNAVKSSFNLFAFGATCNVGRYGQGVYTYLNPAFADRFATSSTSSPFRVMVSCTAVITPAPNADVKDPTISPSGKITSISDDERLFVSSADAIVPSYVILYTK